MQEHIDDLETDISDIAKELLSCLVTTTTEYRTNNGYQE